MLYKPHSTSVLLNSLYLLFLFLNIRNITWKVWQQLCLKFTSFWFSLLFVLFLLIFRKGLTHVGQTGLLLNT